MFQIIQRTKNTHTHKLMYTFSLVNRFTAVSWSKIEGKCARMIVWFHLNYVFRFDSLTNTHGARIWILTAHPLIPNWYKRKWHTIILFQSNRNKKGNNKKVTEYLVKNFRCCSCASIYISIYRYVVYRGQSAGAAFGTLDVCAWAKEEQRKKPTIRPFWLLVEQSVKAHICTALRAFGPFGHDPK